VAGPFDHIACCIDDSGASRQALAQASALRDLGPGRLSIVHVTSFPLLTQSDPEHGSVVDPADIEAEARRWLERQATQVPGAEAVLLHGSPPAAVCEWAREARPDLIVAGAYHGWAERTLVGSFAAFVARFAPCPVLPVREPPDR
jgi:nucleotide-binding universal stress UspA family protein